MNVRFTPRPRLTFSELLVVIAIVAIVAAMVLPVVVLPRLALEHRPRTHEALSP